MIDVITKEEVISHRSEKVLVPASSLKLFTTLSAIHLLGEDFRFSTILGYKGSIDKQGVLKGDLILKGGGDPTLGSERMASCLSLDELLSRLVSQVSQAGITCIKGDIIVDESIFDSYPISPSWQWNDLGNYYASGGWGVNVLENQYKAYFKNRGVVGERPTLAGTDPKIPNLKLSNEVIVDSSHTGDQAYIFGGPYNFDKRIVGTIPQGQGSFVIKGSIPDPPTFMAQILSTALAKANIQSDDFRVQFRQLTTKGFSGLDTIYSPELREIARITNMKSLNLHTEAILKMIGYQERGQGSGQNGIAEIRTILRSYGVDTDNLHFHDGSGLSARNLISSHSMARFLAGLVDEASMEELLYYLPKGGVEGTVSWMFKGTSALGKIWLKSGSCLLYTSPSPRDRQKSRMPSSA